jgi:HK97 family phage major capsid protein
VHPEFEKGVYKIMNDYGIYKDCKLSPMSSNTKYITKRITGADVFYVDQATAYANQEMTWDRVELVAKKIGAILPVTYELIEDNASDEDIRSQAQIELAEGFAKFIDTEVLTGTNSGASKILGVTRLAEVNVTTLTGTISTLTSDKLIDCSRSVKQKFKKINKPKWYMNESAIATIEKIKDTA